LWYKLIIMVENKEPVAGQNTNQSSEPPEIGRPTIYTPDVAAELFAYLAMGESLRTACAHDGIPSVPTVFRWLSTSNNEPWAADFREQYARAKEEAADAMAEEILYIADTQVTGEITVTKKTGKGDPVTETRKEDMLGHRRLQIDTRKFLMAKMKPKRYGDKLDLTSDGEKIERGMSIEEINAVLARADADAKQKAAAEAPATT
jgi:hypothetical protein